MANGVNKMIIVGNLGRDPEVRYAQSGMAICTLSVAVSESKKDGDEWKEHTEWFRVKTFGRTAENASQYLAKGRQVYVEGKGRHDKYTDKEGIERHTFEVIADNLVFLSSGSGEGKQRKLSTDASGTTADAKQDEGFHDDDLPY